MVEAVKKLAISVTDTLRVSQRTQTCQIIQYLTILGFERIVMLPLMQHPVVGGFYGKLMITLINVEKPAYLKVTGLHIQSPSLPR
ncbi:hypothetical protein ACFL5W_02515 [Thermodesulfobacteriota bacterium]